MGVYLGVQHTAPGHHRIGEVAADVVVAHRVVAQRIHNCEHLPQFSGSLQYHAEFGLIYYRQVLPAVFLAALEVFRKHLLRVGAHSNGGVIHMGGEEVSQIAPVPFLCGGNLPYPLVHIAQSLLYLLVDCGAARQCAHLAQIVCLVQEHQGEQVAGAAAGEPSEAAVGLLQRAQFGDSLAAHLYVHAVHA